MSVPLLLAETPSFEHMWKVGKYLQLNVDQLMDRTPINLRVLYFRRKKPGCVQLELDEDSTGEKYTAYVKVGILKQVWCEKLLAVQ